VVCTETSQYNTLGLLEETQIHYDNIAEPYKRGRGSANKSPFVAAVVINEEGHPTRMHMCVI